MRRKYILCAVGLAACLFAGCGRHQSQMEYIGVEEAKRVALADAGMPSAEVEFTAADLASRSGQDYYQVDFTAAGERYKYDIDALTGVVIHAVTPQDSQDPAANAGADTQTGTNPDAGDTQAGTNPDAGDTQAGTNSDAGANTGTNAGAASADSRHSAGTGQNAGKTMLTDKEAQAKALSHAQVSDREVTFVKSELDFEDGRKVYDVEFYTSDRKEYDYEIDAYTGEVIRYDYDMESELPPADNTKTISADKARKLALAQVPGAADNDIWEFEEDYEDGRMVYEGKILYNGMEYEFEIDAYSGSFRSWEAEPVDD